MNGYISKNDICFAKYIYKNMNDKFTHFKHLCYYCLEMLITQSTKYHIKGI